jgi:hypothetical protein
MSDSTVFGVVISLVALAAVFLFGARYEHTQSNSRDAKLLAGVGFTSLISGAAVWLVLIE